MFMYIIIISTLLNSFTFSPSAQNLPFSQVFPTIDFYGTLPLDWFLGLRLLSELIMLIVLFYVLITISFTF